MFGKVVAQQQMLAEDMDGITSLLRKYLELTIIINIVMFGGNSLQDTVVVLGFIFRENLQISFVEFIPCAVFYWFTFLLTDYFV